MSENVDGFIRLGSYEELAMPLPIIHATAVALGDRAILLIGPSGSGKSDLALRLIDRGAVLIADDQVVIERDDVHGCLFASAPIAIVGLIEVRGVGIMTVPHTLGWPVALVVDLAGIVPRVPEIAVRDIAGVAVPCMTLVAHEASACLKVELGLSAFGAQSQK